MPDKPVDGYSKEEIDKFNKELRLFCEKNDLYLIRKASEHEVSKALLATLTVHRRKKNGVFIPDMSQAERENKGEAFNYNVDEILTSRCFPKGNCLICDDPEGHLSAKNERLNARWEAMRRELAARTDIITKMMYNIEKCTCADDWEGLTRIANSGIIPSFRFVFDNVKTAESMISRYESLEKDKVSALVKFRDAYTLTLKEMKSKFVAECQQNLEQNWTQLKILTKTNLDDYDADFRGIASHNGSDSKYQEKEAEERIQRFKVQEEFEQKCRNEFESIINSN